MMPADLYRHLILAVDPGLRGCGCALFGGGELKAAGYVPNPAEGRGPPADIIRKQATESAIGALRNGVVIGMLKGSRTSGNTFAEVIGEPLVTMVVVKDRTS